MQAYQMNTSSVSELAAQVITLKSHREEKQECNAFTGNLEHLQALEHEAKLMVAMAVLRDGRLPKEEGEDNEQSSILPEGTSYEQANDLLRTVSNNNRLREVQAAAKGVELPFVQFCENWMLDNVERQIVMLLLMQFSSRSFYRLYVSSRLEKNCDNGMEIGALLTIISGNFREHLENRRYFSVHGSLLRNELLSSNCIYCDSNTSILRMSVYLHERFVRHILGDDNQYHIAFKFIKEERSGVSLEQVVLSDNMKNVLLEHAERYMSGRRNGSFEHLDEFFGYGTGLTFLFHGPSGTGKTMLAKGLANRLSCPLISLDMKDMQKIGMSNDEVLSMLFREASLLGGIVFLDECDDLFNCKQNSSLSRALLLEIEKSRCITILATNQPLDLDPAMERRISMKIAFQLPDEKLRKEIWQSLLPPDAILSPDLDLWALARQFHFSGGLIKNSILLATTSSTLHETGRPLLTQKALMDAASRQAISMSDVTKLCETISPVSSLDLVPVGHLQRDLLRGLSSAWHWLLSEGMGLNLLISCSNLTTAIQAVSGLAAECGLTVHAYDLFKISSLAEADKILDMTTQQKIYPLTAAFREGAAGQSLTLIIDYQGEMVKQLEEGTNKSPLLMFTELFHQMRHNTGFFCLVTKGIKAGSIPVEFHQMISIDCPPEELQMQCWETGLGAGVLQDDELVGLVEKYPMHSAEIEFIARQAKVHAIMSGRGTPELHDVIHVVSNYRRPGKGAMLFGGGK